MLFCFHCSLHQESLFGETMFSLFDPTGWVTAVARYVAQKYHPHDDVCFYGVVDRERDEFIAQRRKTCAERIIQFYRFNHAGLLSNCSSFAEYVRHGNLHFVEKAYEHYGYEGTLYRYRGQHIIFGDVVMISYVNEWVIESGLLKSKHTPNIMREFVACRQEIAKAADFSKANKEEVPRNAHALKYTPLEIRDNFLENPLLRDYHFLVCVGYEIHPGTGNLEPVFVNQDGRNFQGKEHTRILLPPFGKLVVSFLSDHVEPEEKVPAFLFCSKP